jgi:hypothetical protein
MSHADAGRIGICHLGGAKKNRGEGEEADPE